MNSVTVRPARREDLEHVIVLLQEASLPVLGVAEHLHHFLVAERSGDVVGSIGLEAYKDTALLRSAVVSRREQRKGIGAQLYDALIVYARALRVKRILLLTNTAAAYFERRGFKKIDRQSVTGPVTSSVEFTGACPAHAACMQLLLDPLAQG